MCLWDGVLVVLLAGCVRWCQPNWDMCKGGGLFVYRSGYTNVLIYLCVWLCIVCTYLKQVSGCGYFSVRAGAQLVRGLGGSIMK